MTTLAADQPRDYYEGNYHDFPVIATDIIYQGAAVGDNASGYARPLVSGDRFLGFSDLKVDNSTGAAGDKYVTCRRRGLIRLSVASVAITDVGRPVYASDDNTFALAGIGTKIGYVAGYVSSGVALVAFDADVQEHTYTIALPVVLSTVADGDVLTTYTPGHHGRVKKIDFAVTNEVTTAAKLTTLNAEIGTTNLTGGTVALTSANCATLGAVVAGAAITGAAGFTATDTISIEAASTTAFIEGEGVLLITIGN
jgi:hypothetical protein